jgi:hypothetical protein
MESTDGFTSRSRCTIIDNKMPELMIMDFVGRIHREVDGRIIIEIPEMDQNYLTELLTEDIPVRITVEKLDTNSWMSA